MLNDPDATLEEVLRQARGSEILNLATRIRQGDMSMDHAKDKDVKKVKSAETMFLKALEAFRTADYQKDASYARMLVFRSDRRKGINLRMGQVVVGRPEPYVEDEWLVM